MSNPDGRGQRERGLARLSSGVLVTNVVAAVALLGTTVLTARAFGPQGRGELSLATQFVTLVATLGSLGLTAAAAYHSARAKWSKPVAFGSSTVLGLLLGLLILAGCYLVILVGDVSFRGLSATDLALVSLALPFLLAVATIQSVYQGFRNFRAFNRITLAQAALPLLLIGLAIAVGGGVRAAIVATVAAAALLFVAVLIGVLRSTGIVWRTKLADLRALASFGLRVHPANVLGYLGYRLDVSSSTATRALRPWGSTVPASSSPRASGCRRRPSAPRSFRPSPRRRVRPRGSR